MFTPWSSLHRVTQLLQTQYRALDQALPRAIGGEVPCNFLRIFSPFQLHQTARYIVRILSGRACHSVCSVRANSPAILLFNRGSRLPMIRAASSNQNITFVFQTKSQKSGRHVWLTSLRLATERITDGLQNLKWRSFIDDDELVLLDGAFSHAVGSFGCRK